MTKYLTHIPFGHKQQLELVRNQTPILTFVTFCLYVLACVLVALTGHQRSFGALNTGITAIGLLAGIVNASWMLGIFPIVFAFISHKLGAMTYQHEVRSIAALSLVPVIACTLLGIVPGLQLPATALGMLLSTGVFVYGLGLTNGVSFLEALRHTLAVWLIMLILALLITFLIGLLKGGHH